MKLLATMAINYKLDLLNQKMLNGMLQPLLRNKDPKYFKLTSWEVLTYLQCLAAYSTLSECQLLEMDSAIFNEKSIQYLIGMSIKHGNTGIYLNIDFIYSEEILKLLFCGFFRGMFISTIIS